MTGTAPLEPSTPDDAAEIRVVSGNPTPEEVAAVTAVLAGLEGERVARSAERSEAAGPNAWARSQRPLRETVHPGFDRWRQGRP